MQIVGGRFNGHHGTVLRWNGSNCHVALHGPDEIALRDLAGTVYVVRREHARQAAIVSPQSDNVVVVL